MKTLIVSASSCAEPGHGTEHACSYRVEWKINPHMQIGGAQPHRSRSQHAAFVRALCALGASVVELPFVHGAYDSIFAKDSAVLREEAGVRSALLARPRYAERRLEQGARATQLALAGFQVQRAPEAGFEGGDVVVLPHLQVALLGYGFRSELGAVRPLARFLDRHVLPLELRDPSLYHLDTALAVLDDGSLLVCEDAFTDAALRLLRSLPWTAYFRIPRAEALDLALNFVELGEHVLSGSDGVTTGVQTGRALGARGRQLVCTPLGQFHLAGGSAACLIAQVLGARPARLEPAALAA